MSFSLLKNFPAVVSTAPGPARLPGHERNPLLQHGVDRAGPHMAAGGGRHERRATINPW